MGFPGGSAVKNLPAMWETRVRFLGWEDPLKKGKATHSCVLAWRIPWCHKELDMNERLSLHGSLNVGSIKFKKCAGLTKLSTSIFQSLS